MKVLITGSNGLLGQKLIGYYLQNPETEFVATARGENRNLASGYRFRPMDITSREQVLQVIGDENPDVIINTAAMTQVDQCETDREACWELNVTAVENIVAACEANKSFLVHLSTDFVFDGEDGPYREDDQPNPISYYAESKLAAEKVLEESAIGYAIVRTMLVYGIVNGMSRSNIILWVKKSLEEGKNIKVVNDQWRMPTLAEDLAKGCALAAEKQHKGIFHISGKDMLTPYDMAVATANFFGLDHSLMEKVDGSIFTQPAKRPPKTGFILDKSRELLGYEPVSFEEGLAKLKSQL